VRFRAFRQNRWDRLRGNMHSARTFRDCPGSISRRQKYVEMPRFSISSTISPTALSCSLKRMKELEEQEIFKGACIEFRKDAGRGAGA